VDSLFLEHLATLRRIPLLSDLCDGELRMIAGRLTRLHFEAGTVIFSQGDLCREFLVVEGGEVRLIRSAASGRRQLLSIERKGSALAEVAALDGGRYPVTAEAATDTSLLHLPAENFREICIRNPEMARKVFKVLAGRLRHLVALVEELSFSTVRARLITHLLWLAGQSGFPTAHGVQFQLTENNEDLAARLGTVRELISRNLGRLYGDRLILMSKRTVTIPDVLALRREIDISD
jgi:CRP-like cAMP-binding protein